MRFYGQSLCMYLCPVVSCLQFNQVLGDLEAIYSKAKLCNNPTESSKACYNLDPGLFGLALNIPHGIEFWNVSHVIACVIKKEDLYAFFPRSQNLPVAFFL